MNNETRNESLQNVLTESDLCELLGMTKEQLGDLRRSKGLAFIKLSQTRRLYLESDLMEFFHKNRVTLNRFGTE